MNLISLNKSMKNKKVAVIGAGKSGLSACKLLKKLEAIVFLSEKNKNYNIKELEKNSDRFEFGVHSEKILDNELIVISPGISKNKSIFKKAKDKNIPIISELELSSWFTNFPIIAITGSNGKTTTTKILENIFKETNLNVFVSGNIGIPFSEIVLNNIEKNVKNGLHIIEVSSFQLEDIFDFKPKIAIILNISEDHLDRYHSMKNYINAKMNIAKNMEKNDKLIFNSEDVLIVENIKTKAKSVGFSLKKNIDEFFFIDKNKIYNSKEQKLVSIDDINLLGDHNIQNILAAATAAKVYEISDKNIRNGIQKTYPVDYRLQKVNEINQISFFNDSKSTNVDSIIVAINSFHENLILILGGRDKGGNFKKIITHLKNKVKQIIIFGESKKIIEMQIKEFFPIYIANSMKEAIHFSFKNAKSGDSILLSPGCTSYDMYDNFEHRGKDFNIEVSKLILSQKKIKNINYEL
tara:strand:- start:14650 stop:16044 length:1395 start_codon:yes stop_codon:yes gene_type:complete